MAKTNQKIETQTAADIAPQASTKPAEIDEVVQAIVSDEYAGQGGSYIFDPATGKRTPNPD